MNRSRACGRIGTSMNNRPDAVILYVIPLEASLKFRLSTFLLIIACIGIGAGWIWERQFYEAKLEEQVYTLQDAECSIIGAFHKNLFAQRLKRLENGEISQEEFDRFRERALLDNVIYLYLNEHLATNTKFDLSYGVTFSTDQQNRMLWNAGMSLHLLGLDSLNNVNDKLSNDTDRIDWFGDDLYASNNEINESFADFVERSIERYLEHLNLGKESG